MPCRKSHAERFMTLLSKLRDIELIGVGKLLQIDAAFIRKAIMDGEWENFIIEATAKFLKKTRKERREILKFLKEVVEPLNEDSQENFTPSEVQEE